MICPVCGGEIDDEGTVFIVQGKFYCNELCGKRARIKPYEELVREET